MTLFLSCVCCFTFIVCLLCIIGHPIGDLSDVKRKLNANDQWPLLRRRATMWPNQDGSSEHVVQLVNGLNEKFIKGFENASIKQKVANIVNNIYVISTINGTVVNVGREFLDEKDIADSDDTAVTPTKPPEYLSTSEAITVGVKTTDFTEKTVQPSTKKAQRLHNTTSRTTKDNNTPVTCRCISKSTFRI